jgi:hypothetical protein
MSRSACRTRPPLCALVSQPIRRLLRSRGVLLRCLVRRLRSLSRRLRQNRRSLRLSQRASPHLSRLLFALRSFREVRLRITRVRLRLAPSWSVLSVRTLLFFSIFPSSVPSALSFVLLQPFS